VKQPLKQRPRSGQGDDYHHISEDDEHLKDFEEYKIVRILLDTHTIYWYTTGDPQLSAMAQAAIQDTTNEVLISPASLWEIVIIR